MKEFEEGKIDILVSTSVVEVGVNVPNATNIIIEGAERFGLAQLHQLRGRVGRGNVQSYCFLFAEGAGKNTRERLKAIENSNDGFKLAERDLKIRGPGQFMGLRQSGFPDISMSALTNAKLIKKTKQPAEEFIANLDQYPLLKKRFQSFAQDVHME